MIEVDPRIPEAPNPISVKKASPNEYKDLGVVQPIYMMQSRDSRAINVGLIKKDEFVPGRLFLGSPRAEAVARATIQTLQLQEAQEIINRYPPSSVSTVTLLREALAHSLPNSLYHAGLETHFGDAFVGVTHDKSGGKIVANREYANIEGLRTDGLWIVADSICMARNLHNVMESLLEDNHPDEIIYLSSIASRRGIREIGRLTAEKGIPTTFFAWGALFGVNDENLYDMPWGHPDTEPLDERDRDTFVEMYGIRLCVGGDFGNDYFAKGKALELYEAQLREHGVTPNIPTVGKILDRYSREEILFEA